MGTIKPNSIQPKLFSVLGFAVIIASLVLVGCGGTGSPVLSQNNGPAIRAFASSQPNAPLTPLQLQIGDNPNASEKQIVAFQISLGSATARNSATGDWVEVLNNGSTELTHSATTTNLIASGGAPQMTYDQLDLVYTGAYVSYLDDAGNVVMQNLTPPQEQIIDLTQAPNTPIVVGADPSIVGINIDVAGTVSLNGPGITAAGRKRNGAVRTMGTAIMGTPVVSVSQYAISASNQQIQHLIGNATSVTGNIINITPNQSNTMVSFNTDPNLTDFENITLSTAQDMLVEINGSTQADGSLFADEVEAIDASTGSELEGVLAGYTGSGFMYMVVQDGIGSGVTSGLVGKKVTVDPSGASYEVNSGKIDMTGVNVSFDESHIFPGQRVEAESSSGLITPDPDGNNGQIYPFMIELEQQTINGTVANYQPGAGNVATFDLVLPTDGSSYLQLLNPAATAVHIYQQANTTRSGLPAAPAPLSAGQQVQVRGLLFCLDVSDTAQQGTNFVMVAARITRQDR